MDAAAASIVRIAVNDLSAGQQVLFDDDLLVPLRAVRSLSRLDSVLRAEKHDISATDMLAACHLAYKCPSFPRIDRYSSVDEMRLALDADSMSPRLSNATLSQDLDGELLALSTSNLCVPGERTSSRDATSSRRHDATLTRSASARTVRLAPDSTATGTTLDNFLSPPSILAVTTTTTNLPRRSLARSTSCPSMSSPLHLSPSPSSLLQPPSAISSSSTQRNAGRLPVTTAATSTKAGKGRAQFDSDVDLDTERVTDLPVIATSDFPDFLYEPSAGVKVSTALPLTGAQLTVAHVRRYDADIRLLAQLGAYRPCRQRAPQLVQIKCLRWLSSLDHGAV